MRRRLDRLAELPTASIVCPDINREDEHGHQNGKRADHQAESGGGMIVNVMRIDQVAMCHGAPPSKRRWTQIELPN
jgi:hypothetical protein